jgi:cytochrome c553
MLRSIAMGGALLALAAAAGAQEDVKVRGWAAGCNACHGPGGRSEAGMPSLAGRDKSEMFKYLMEIKEGKRNATVMHQIGKGFSNDELQRITEYFARLPK